MRRAGFLVQDRMHGVYIVFTGKRALARHHFVKDHPEREDVASMINPSAEDLLRGHVIYRSHDSPGLCPHVNYRFLSAVYLGLIAAGELGESEVEDLGVSIAADHQVLGFEIAVHNSILVCFSESFGALNREIQSN